MAPNTIDFTSLDFDPVKNPVIYITLSIILGKLHNSICHICCLMLMLQSYTIITYIPVIAVLYVGLVIWARRADKKDLIKLGCTPLVCNDPLDRYLYEIVVNTGSRQDAGTKSKVNAESDVALEILTSDNSWWGLFSRTQHTGIINMPPVTGKISECFMSY